MKPLFDELWPLRRATAPKMTEAERAYRATVRANKRRLRKQRQRSTVKKS